MTRLKRVKSLRFLMLVVLTVSCVSLIKNLRFVDVATAAGGTTLTVSDSGTELSVVNTWNGGTEGYNFTILQSAMVIDRLYDYEIDDWIWNGDQSDSDSKGVAIHAAAYEVYNSYDSTSDWSIIEESDTRAVIYVWGAVSLGGATATFKWNITVYAGQPTFFFYHSVSFNVTQNLVVYRINICDKVQDDAFTPSSDADFTDDVLVTNATYGGVGVGHISSGVNGYDPDASSSTGDSLQWTDNLATELSADELFDCTSFFYVHSQTDSATAISLTDELDDELCDDFADITSASGLTYDGRNNMTGAFDFTHSSGNDASFTFTDVDTEQNFTAFHIDGWGTSSYVLWKGTTLQTENTTYYASYNTTSQDLDIVWADPLSTATIAIQDSMSKYALTLQARDASGTDLPSAVTFSGTHGNGSSFSVTSGTSGSYPLTTCYGSHTVYVDWGTHRTGSGSTTVTADTTLNINTKIRRLDSGNKYALISLNNTDLSAPQLQADTDIFLQDVSASGAIEIKVHHANWKRSDQPTGFTVGTSQYGQGDGSWSWTDSIFTLTHTYTGTQHVTLSWQPADGGGGGGGGGTVPSEPSAPEEEGEPTEEPTITPVTPIVAPNLPEAGAIFIIVVVVGVVAYAELKKRQTPSPRKAWKQRRKVKRPTWPNKQKKTPKWKKKKKWT